MEMEKTSRRNRKYRYPEQASKNVRHPHGGTRGTYHHKRGTRLAKYKRMNDTLKKQIEEVLNDTPDTRNSDIALMHAVWERFYRYMLGTDQNGRLYIALEDMYDVPREDTVKRLRAFFTTEGKYLPTSLEVAKQRRINEDRWREALGYPPKE